MDRNALAAVSHTGFIKDESEKLSIRLRCSKFARISQINYFEQMNKTTLVIQKHKGSAQILHCRFQLFNFHVNSFHPLIFLLLCPAPQPQQDLVLGIIFNIPHTFCHVCIVYLVNLKCFIVMGNNIPNSNLVQTEMVSSI